MSLQGSPDTLERFARYVTLAMGLHFSEQRIFELDRRMSALAREAGYPDLEQYLLELMSAPLSRETLELLARTLTIGETYFLRDPRSYQVLERQLLPELVARRRRTGRTLRIWSAGCSTGEEPYTLAILLSRIIPDLAEWNVSLLATDINPQALERARQGLYSQWSFRDAPAWLMEYFRKEPNGRRYQIVPRIRSMVAFAYQNLVGQGSDPQPAEGAPFDVIFCRNVMLYFEPQQIQQTMARFHAALGAGGYLFVGPTEVDQRFQAGFSCRRLEGAFVLTKNDASRVEGAPLARQSESDTPPDALACAGPPAKRAAAAPLPAPLVEDRTADASRQTGSGDPVQPGPDSPDAVTLYQEGLYELAADLVRQALEAGPQPAETLALGARAYANLGRFDEARQLCEQALAADRLSAQSHYLLSIILEQQSDPAGAVSSLKRALFIDPDFLLAHVALGNLCRKAGEQRESERNFGNALRLLELRDPREVLPEAEGMTAGRLAQVIRDMTRTRSGHGTK